MSPDELLNMNSATISPSQAAPMIPCNPYSINLAARDPRYRSELGFPVILIGNRVRIPRIPFLKFLGLIPEEGKNNENKKT